VRLGQKVARPAVPKSICCRPGAARGRRPGRPAHLLLALVDVAAGVIALVWPGPTALVLVLIVGIWAVMAGIFEIFAGFAPAETAGTRALFFLTGLVSVAFGVVLFAHPNIGAFALALLFGLYSLVYGVSLIVMGIDARRTAKDVHKVMADAA